MKLLFDENLSPKLVEYLVDIYPHSAHVDRIGLGAQSDHEVWEYAKVHNYTIVSKDADFYEKSLLLGYPPRLIWIRRGNCSTRQIEIILRHHVEVIKNFSSDPKLAYLILL